jgi:hypothetical protein
MNGLNTLSPITLDPRVGGFLSTRAGRRRGAVLPGRPGLLGPPSEIYIPRSSQRDPFSGAVIFSVPEMWGPNFFRGI